MIDVIRAIGSAGLFVAGVCLAGAVVIRAADAHTPEAADEATLKQLNQQYVNSFLKSDVQWYQQHLTEDFVCIEGDGTILDKAAFLRDTAKGPGVAGYQLVDVRVRFVGDVALIHAEAKTTRTDGTTIGSRYTDVYVRVHGEWKTASAQITSIRPPKSTS